MRTRFAPSPTGLLHIGNAYSALQCELWAQKLQAELLLRIEDIDFTRCLPQYSQQLLSDLHWLGLKFSGEVTYQLQRLPYYQQALERLKELGVLYPCFCTRKQLQGNLKQHLFDGYPGTCRVLNAEQRAKAIKQGLFSWRLDCDRVSRLLGSQLAWTDLNGTLQPFRVEDIGDVIIGRKDIHYSYHLAVVVDDALQGVTHVIRGEDLRTSTPVHKILQLLLGFESPLYLHHPLIKDELGERLAKTKHSTTLKSLRDSGVKAEDFREYLKTKEPL